MLKQNVIQEWKVFAFLRYYNKMNSYLEKVNNWLANKGIETIEIDLKEISKQGGLFRCTTLPLIRK